MKKIMMLAMAMTMFQSSHGAFQVSVEEVIPPSQVQPNIVIPDYSRVKVLNKEFIKKNYTVKGKQDSTIVANAIPIPKDWRIAVDNIYQQILWESEGETWLNLLERIAINYDFEFIINAATRLVIVKTYTPPPKKKFQWPWSKKTEATP